LRPRREAYEGRHGEGPATPARGNTLEDGSPRELRARVRPNGWAQKWRTLAWSKALKAGAALRTFPYGRSCWALALGVGGRVGAKSRLNDKRVMASETAFTCA